MLSDTFLTTIIKFHQLRQDARTSDKSRTPNVHYETSINANLYAQFRKSIISSIIDIYDKKSYVENIDNNILAHKLMT